MNDQLPSAPAADVDPLTSLSVEELVGRIHRLDRAFIEITELRDEALADLERLQRFAGTIAGAIGEKTAWEMRNQEIAQKWRAKNQVLINELQLAQVGLTSGCGCPIGECLRRGSESSSCWMQWAEVHVLQRMAHMRISELQRHAIHPSRFTQARAEGKRPAPRLSAEPDPE